MAAVSEKELRQRLPERLNSALKARGVSKADLIAETGISSNAIHAYLAGKRLPGFIQLITIAQVLDVSVSVFLDFARPEVQTSNEVAPSPADIEILQYIQVENDRGYLPGHLDVAHACEVSGQLALRQVKRLLEQQLLEFSGLKISDKGRQLAKDEGAI